MHLENSGNNIPDPSFNPRLYQNLRDWQPDPCEEPHASAFDKFEQIVTSLRKDLPTYRRFNSRPIQRRALSALRKDEMSIIYPTDKGLGPYLPCPPPNLYKAMPGRTFEQQVQLSTAYCRRSRSRTCHLGNKHAQPL